MVLVDLSMPPISGIPQAPRTANDVLEGVGTVLECMRLQPRSLGLGVTFSSVVLLLFSSIFLLYVNI
jgi:hypothetical protein